MGAEAASQGRGHRWSDWTSHLRSIVGWVDIEQARYALNVSIAAILALAIAFFFNLQNTYWALLTIPLIVRQQSGTMVWRSAARLAGTLLGALVAMVLVGAFAQSGPAVGEDVVEASLKGGALAQAEGSRKRDADPGSHQ